MAAQDKLIPTALLLANNLKGTSYSTAGTYKLPAKKASKYQNPYTDAVKFFADVYQREVLIANQLEGTVPPVSEIFTKLYTPNQNNRALTLGMVVAFSEFEWEELQIAISRAFNIVYPFDQFGPWTKPEIDAYEIQMGTFWDDSTDLKAADNTILASQLTPGPQWAEAWNTLRVPYDKAQGINTPFIAPILKPSQGQHFYYRYTGPRRWFGFNGYDLM